MHIYVYTYIHINRDPAGRGPGITPGAIGSAIKGGWISEWNGVLS